MRVAVNVITFLINKDDITLLTSEIIVVSVGRELKKKAEGHTPSFTAGTEKATSASHFLW